MTQGVLGFDEVPIGGQFALTTNDRGVLSGTVLDPTAIIGAATLLGQTKIVAKNGKDATGDGSLAKPFLTIQGAISSITDATSAKPYTVLVSAGVYTETFAIEPWFYVQGLSSQACYLNPTTANWISAAFAAGTQDAGLSGFTLQRNLTVDFSLVGSTGAGTFKLSDCILGSAVALAFKGNNVGNVAQLSTLLSIGPTSSALTLTNITSNVGSCNLRNGTLTMASTDAYATTHRCESLSTGGAVNVTWTGANTANPLTVVLYSSPLPVNPTTLSVTGAGANVYTRGEVQLAGPDAATTFSFGRIPNGGTVIGAQGADNSIVASPTLARVYTLEGPGAAGTRLRIVNQSLSAITVAYAAGATGPALVVAAGTTANLYASSTTAWN